MWPPHSPLLPIVALLFSGAEAFLSARPVQNARLLRTSSSSAVTASAGRAVYLDISVAGSDLGRLVFRLAPEDVMPLHVENFRALATGEKMGIDPKATYVGCTFEHSPMYVEGSQYKWAHVCKGKGRNAVGRPTETISDPYAQKANTHDAYGGAYYGLKYNEDDASMQDGVVLVVPLMGPGRGTSRFNIVRVGDSPPSWGTRLLMNQAVIGTLESGGEVLRAMARQTDGKPTIAGCGEVDSDADADAAE